MLLQAFTTVLGIFVFGAACLAAGAAFGAAKWTKPMRHLQDDIDTLGQSYNRTTAATDKQLAQIWQAVARQNMRLNNLANHVEHLEESCDQLALAMVEHVDKAYASPQAEPTENVNSLPAEPTESEPTVSHPEQTGHAQEQPGGASPQ